MSPSSFCPRATKQKERNSPTRDDEHSSTRESSSWMARRVYTLIASGVSGMEQENF